MFFEEIKQLFFIFRNSVNIFLSTNFNDGLLVPEEKLDFIFFGFVFLFFVMSFFGLILLWRLKTKNKSISKEASNEIAKEKVEELESADAEQPAKEEKILIRDKDGVVKYKNKDEKIQGGIISEEKGFSNQELKVKDLDLKKGTKTDERLGTSISFIDRLRKGIDKTRNQLRTNISNVVLGKKQIDEELLEDLEEILLSSDIGPETTHLIIESITKRVERKQLTNPQALQEEIQDEIRKIMDKKYPVKIYSERKPIIILVVGVNGVGKTTTIGKIASQFCHQGKKVLMGAGDTYRAAAIEQLVEWSNRAGCEILFKDHGSDPSSVIHETVQKGINENFDVVICDTAGRLHTKKNLMEELKKMIRVIKKLIPDAPHEVFLVLDATTGQNAILQTREFKEVTNLTGLIITKLDGTSKGGVVIGIVNEFEIPVRYIGVGEQVEDLRPFDSKQFTESIFT